LEKVGSAHCPTNAQKSALQSAITSWRTHDEKRPIFSHGIVTELLDRVGKWYVQIDYLAIQKGVCEARRSNWSKAEAELFEVDLHNAYTGLARELGQLRKRLTA
jgi:hypothetical protein